MKRIALAAPIALALALPAAAQDIDCDNAMSQHEMNFCALERYEAADAELNRVYKEVRTAMRSLDADLPPNLKGAEEALRDAQRAWIAFRDKACEVEGYLFRGGSMEPFMVTSCMTGLTEDRTDALRYLLTGL